jgi:hypothetical protein
MENIKKRIKSFRQQAARHRKIFIKSRDRADKLEYRILLQETKDKYEGRYFEFGNALDGHTWTGYTLCQSVTDFTKTGDRVEPTGVFILFEESPDGAISIRKTKTDFASIYCKREITQRKFTREVNKITLNIYRHG